MIDQTSQSRQLSGMVLHLPKKQVCPKASDWLSK